MRALELAIPPLPVLLTVNKATYPASAVHQDRSFPLYDIMIVQKGALYMTEGDAPYEIGENQMLVLEPDRRHYGHRPCAEDTLVYYIHLRHSPAVRELSAEEIPWDTVLPLSTHRDLEPREQRMYLPKYKEVHMDRIGPVLDEMVELRNRSAAEHMLPLQALLARLLVLLQAETKKPARSPSERVSDAVAHYLSARMAEPFRLTELAESLHFSVDYLSKCLKRHTGLTPLQYLNRIRMRKAKALLESTGLPLREIGSLVGIADSNYFFRLFRKEVGMPPGKYRDSLYSRGQSGD